jgi:hypothetical protein
MAEEEKKDEAKEEAKPAKGGDKKKGGSMVGSLIISSIVLTVIAFGFITIGMGYVAAILIIGLLPGVSAHMVDKRPGKYASKTVLAFNISGIMPQMSAMLYSSSPNTVAQALFDNPMTWLWIYMFAAFGWLVIHLLPQITFLIFTIKAEFSMKRIRSFQQMLIKEWGEEVAK